MFKTSLKTDKVRWICLISLAAAAAIALSACGGSTANKEASDASQEQTRGAMAEESPEPTTGKERTDKDEEAEQELEPEGASKAETACLHPMTETCVSSEYDDEGNLLYTQSYEKLSIRDEGYEELKSGLEGLAKERTEQASLEAEVLLEEARAGLLLSSADGFSGYSSESSIEVLRADDRLLSFAETSYSFTGGAHGNSGISAKTLDSKIGAELSLSDIISDKAALETYLIEKLEEEYGSQDMLFEGWEDQVRNEIKELPYEPSDGELRETLNMQLDFAVTENGLRVYFDPYEIGPWALGTVIVDVPYAEEGIGFNEAYLPLSDKSVWPLRAYEEQSLDIDGDGMEESVGLSFQAWEDQSESTYTLYVTDGEETASINGTCGYGMDKAYIMKADDGSYIFYGECRSDNDWRYLSFADLTDMWTGAPSAEASELKEYYEAFYDNVPVSADSFYLSTRGSLLSTVSISREHKTGADGFPKALQEDFYYDGFELRAKTDIKGIDVSSGADAVISPGAELRALSTDESSYVIFEDMAGKAHIRVEIEAETWPHTIDGVDIEQCFEGLIFAG